MVSIHRFFDFWMPWNVAYVIFPDEELVLAIFHTALKKIPCLPVTMYERP